MAKYVLSESAARKLGAMLRGKSSEATAVPDSGATIDDNGYAPPYTVRWSQQETIAGEEGEEDVHGCWIIWLGGGEILNWNGVAVTEFGAIHACEDNPRGWYRLHEKLDSTGSDILYLNVDYTDPDHPEAMFSNGPATGEKIAAIQIASVKTASVTNEKIVNQLIVGAIVGSNPNDGGGGGGQIVNNGKLTIANYGGTPLGTFTANQASDTTINLPAPVLPNDGQLTINDHGGNQLGTFTANQDLNTTITLPDIPDAANNGVLTIADYGGTSLGTFTANQATSTTITLPSIPSAPNNGQLTVNDSAGNQLGTFTANQSSNTTITLPAVPAAPNNGILTIKTPDGESLGTFSANQAANAVITVAGALAGEVDFIGDIRYDITTHQLQKRVDTLDLATGAVVQGQWEMITGGQCTPHSAEHE